MTVVRKTGMELAALVADFEKTVGANAEKSSVTEFINTGYGPLNEIMSGDRNGGLPFGRLIEMFGESSTGKTALATQWMIQAQNMGGVAGFIDWERSFSTEMAVDMGLYTGEPYWMYKKPKTWEEGNMEALRYAKFVRDTKLIDPKAPILIVLDSIASAIPKSVSEKGIDEYTMNDTTALARVTSTTLKNVAQFVEEYNATFLYLNQMRLKPGVVYGDPRTTPGGKAMEFYATVRLALGRTKLTEGTGADKEFIGQKISIQCMKSKLTKPFQECNLRMVFNDDGSVKFDTTTSLLEYLIENSLIEYSKPRVTWTDGKKYFVKELAAKIDAEGLQAELIAKLPA